MQSNLTVYLMRHGQTSWNADNNRYCGLTDLPLTEMGYEQAISSREQLKSFQFDGIYASPLKRAMDTATIVSGGRQVQSDARLTEVNFGSWEGKSREEFIKENPLSWERWNEDPLIHRAGETGENAASIITRVDDFFQSMLQKHPGGAILVVAHNTVNRFYLAHKLGMQPKHYRRIFLDNSTISMFQLAGDGDFILRHLNCKL